MPHRGASLPALRAGEFMSLRAAPRRAAIWGGGAPAPIRAFPHQLWARIGSYFRTPA